MMRNTPGSAEDNDAKGAELGNLRRVGQNGPSRVERLCVRTDLAAFMRMLLVLLLLSSPGFSAVMVPDETTIQPDEIIVVFKPGVSDQEKKSSIRKHGHESLRGFQHLNGHVVGLHGKQTVDEALNSYRLDPRVAYAEPNFRVQAGAIPNDALLGAVWALQNTGQKVGGKLGLSGADIDAVSAWDITTGSSNIVVGVVDTGVAYDHPDLVANMWNNPGGINGGPAGSHGYNVITGGFDPLDDYGHGTHVSGIIGATGNNSVGIAGVNWTVSIMALKFLDSRGSGTTAGAIIAIDFAINAKRAGVNVRVLNNSWGGVDFSQALQDEINLAGANDILFVASAGNNHTNTDVKPFYPASCRASNLVAVAATDNRDLLATFSNYGARTVDLGAPGVNVYSTYFDPATTNLTYAYLSGTSMASPEVSGTAALVLANGYQSATTLRDTLLKTTDPLTNLAGVTTTGGRLNAFKAVTAFALSVAPVAPTIFVEGMQTLTAVVQNGTAPYAYAWSNSAGVYIDSSAAINVQAEDTYFCTVTDSSVPPKSATASTRLTVSKHVSTITWPTPADITYGTALNNSILNASANVAGTLTYSPAAGTVLPAGSSLLLSVTFSPSDAVHYLASTSTVTINVRKAPLLAKAPVLSSVYGSALPALTASYTGFVNGDSEGSLATKPVLTTTAKASSGVSLYPVTITGAQPANYSLTFQNGSIRITPAPLTITAANKSKAYGKTVPLLTTTYTGFVNGDSAAKLNSQAVLGTTASTNSPPGTYPITVSSAASTNYTIKFVNGVMTVNKGALTVTAAAKSKVYGAAIPALTFTVSGFVLGETIANLTTPVAIATTATSSSQVGNYPISVNGASAANYNITFVNSSLTVNPSTATITARNLSLPVGSAIPILTYTTKGFVNGDSVLVLSAPVSLNTTATSVSPAGTYPITISGGTAVNYTVNFVNGTLTLVPPQ